MKLATYSKQGSVSCGILTDQGLIDIVSAWKDSNPPRSVKEILERGQACLEKLVGLEKSVADVIPLDSVKLLAPIRRGGLQSARADGAGSMSGTIETPAA